MATHDQPLDHSESPLNPSTCILAGLPPVVCSPRTRHPRAAHPWALLSASLSQLSVRGPLQAVHSPCRSAEPAAGLGVHALSLLRLGPGGG